jgi:hypothetical protein
MREYHTKNFGRGMPSLKIHQLIIICVNRGKKEASTAAVHSFIVAELNMMCGLGATRPRVSQGSIPPQNLIGISDPEELPAYELLRAIGSGNHNFQMR